MATSATEEEFLQVLDEMNRICGTEDGGSAAVSAEVSGLGFEVGEIEEEDDDEDEDQGRVQQSRLSSQFVPGNYRAGRPICRNILLCFSM